MGVDGWVEVLPEVVLAASGLRCGWRIKVAAELALALATVCEGTLCLIGEGEDTDCGMNEGIAPPRFVGGVTSELAAYALGETSRDGGDFINGGLEVRISEGRNEGRELSDLRRGIDDGDVGRGREAGGVIMDVTGADEDCQAGVADCFCIGLPKLKGGASSSSSSSSSSPSLPKNS